MKKEVSLVLIGIVFCLTFVCTGCYGPSERDVVAVEEGVAEEREKAVAPAIVEKKVNESTRDIPVACDVDVVVVGGTSGGVAAAVEAAKKGASVFLAAERPYVGEDICGTYRLWLEDGEEPASPLAKKLFVQVPLLERFRRGASFTYEADKSSAGVHKDTQPPSVLSDGKGHNAASQSVQYDGDVTITADLAKVMRLKKVHLMAYQRRDSAMGNDFEVESVRISVSDDRQDFRQVATVKNKRAGEALPEPWGPIELSAPVAGQARYVRLSVKKSSDVNRVLLGEIIIESEQGAEEPPKRDLVPPTPMHVKRVLDEALLEAGVQFLFGCYATDLLRDGSGNVAGIVMANRSGRQAVRAKVIIDATTRATVARMAGATFGTYPAGPQTFKRIVVGGEAKSDAGMQARKMPAPILTRRGRSYDAIEYTLSIPMKDGSFASFAEAEQEARDRTWHRGQVYASEVLFQVPPDPMKGLRSLTGAWPGAVKINLGVFRPAGIKRLYVVGGCADVSRGAAEKLLRPLELMRVGRRIGAAAAMRAKATAKPSDVIVRGKPVAPVASGDVRDDSAWTGPVLETIRAEKRSVPVLGDYDVVVVGGGTGGAPAGISAGRQGMRTLVVEYLHGLGGVGTLGLITSYYHGHREGFTKEIDEGLKEFEGKEGGGRGWDPELKIEWYRRQLRKAGVDIWYGTLGCGAFVEGGRVKGVVVATSEGRGVVLAKVVIDSTGKAMVAAAAGAPYIYIDGSHIAVQGTGLPPRELGARYTNTDYTFIDDLDVVDAWRALVVGKDKFKGAYDMGQLVDSRERRQIVGDYFLTPLDAYKRRTFPDTVVQASSNFDSHGFTIHSMFLVKPPDRKEIICYVPYRCLLPKGLDNILVTGLGVSAHRDVMPVIRMQPDIQNQGYAAGLAASTAIKGGESLRDIDIKTLQERLVEKGNLPPEVLTHKDSFPLPKEEVEKAVKTVVNDLEGLETIFAQPQQALPLLQEAYNKYVEEPFAGSRFEEEKLTYAHILGIMGDPAGADTLAEAVQSKEWDKGWKFKGMGQFGESASEVDRLIIALGRTRKKQALKPILEKVEQLGPEHAFSHHRAVSLALQTLGDRAAVKPLAELLKKPGMTGYTFTDIDVARRSTPPGSTDNTTREHSLRELVLARALYRCGDYEGVGEKILKEYARDLRGHYRRHAQAVLGEKD